MRACCGLRCTLRQPQLRAAPTAPHPRRCPTCGLMFVRLKVSSMVACVVLWLEAGAMWPRSYLRNRSQQFAGRSGGAPDHQLAGGAVRSGGLVGKCDHIS